MSKRKTAPQKKCWARAAELARARAKLGLNISQMVDLFRRSGLPGTNWGTYQSWELGTVTPRPPFERAVFEIIAKAQK